MTPATGRRRRNALPRAGPGEWLLPADSEHFGRASVGYVRNRTPFDLRVPTPSGLSSASATNTSRGLRFPLGGNGRREGSVRVRKREPRLCPRIVQRTGERQDPFRVKFFPCACDRDAIDALTLEYSKRRRAEEFFTAVKTAENARELRNTPAQLEAEAIDPRIPGLSNFKLDFRFK